MLGIEAWVSFLVCKTTEEWEEESHLGLERWLRG